MSSGSASADGEAITTSADTPLGAGLTSITAAPPARATSTRPAAGETWALVPSVEYRDQNSNYDIRAYDDLMAMLGVQKRF